MDFDIIKCFRPYSSECRCWIIELINDIMKLNDKHDEKNIHYSCHQGIEGRGNKEYYNTT